MSDSEPPERFDPYRILEELGEGGMGTVYLAEQCEPVRRRVALKVIKLGMDTKEVLARFEAERQALALLAHPNIAKALDAGSSSRGRPYFVMEHVPGLPLTVYCSRQRLGLRARLELFGQVCRAVQHAHQKGIIHRDLKPSNVLVQVHDGVPLPKIIDFGVAKATQHRLTERTLFTRQGQMIGTPEYMSPEQAEMSGLEVDTRSDVYSLGVMLYELLTGFLPLDPRELREAGFLEIQRRIREEEPRKPSTRLETSGDSSTQHAREARTEARTLVRRLRGDLDWITMKALAKDANQRFQSASELAADLERHLGNEPVLAGPPGIGYRIRKLVRRYRRSFVAAALVLLSLIAGLVSSTILYFEAEDARRTAEANERTATHAKAAAERHLANFERLADLVTLDKLVVEARDELWHERPRMAEAISRWLVRARSLADALPGHRASLDRLRASARQAPGSVGSEAWSFRSTEEQFLHDSLTELVDGLTGFVGPGGSLRRVEDRLDWARSVQRITIDEPRELWSSARSAVARDPRFAGLELEPLLGLIPLGPDPATGLQEFAHPRSGPLVVRHRRTRRLRPMPDSGLVFVLVPGGSVWIGAQSADEDKPNFDAKARPNEKPVQGVRLEPFFLSKYELTQAQWRRLSGAEDPSRFPGPELPVNMVNWKDSARLLSHFGLCLPTEAQWEYDCRGGTSTPWWTGAARESLQGGPLPAVNIADAAAARRGISWPQIDEWPLYDDGYDGPAPVFDLLPNPLGFHHMLGNVWEWCRDEYGLYGATPFRDGEGARVVRSTLTELYVLRGGSFDYSVYDARASRRVSLDAKGGYNLGLRPARKIDQ